MHLQLNICIKESISVSSSIKFSLISDPRILVWEAYNDEELLLSDDDDNRLAVAVLMVAAKHI